AFDSRVSTASAPQYAALSVMAGTTIAEPSQIFGSNIFLCSSVQASKIICALSTPEVKSGPGTGPCPNASNTTAQSIIETPEPPYSSGNIMPSQPISAAFLISCGWNVCLFLYHWVIWCAGTSALTKSSATFLNSSWVSVRLKSICFSYWNNWNHWNFCNEKLLFQA